MILFVKMWQVFRDWFMFRISCGDSSLYILAMTRPIKAVRYYTTVLSDRIKYVIREI